MALVATNIGGGILGVPFAFYHMGMINGVFVCLSVAILSHISSMLYLRLKDLTPRKYESIYEIAYLLTGRSSIFVVCAIQLAMVFSSMLIYYMIIGDTIAKLFA